MIKHFLIGLMLLGQLTILAQEKVITGKITDNIGEPLIGVLICQVNTNNCTYSDYNGLFHLLTDDKHAAQLKIEHIGYKTLIFSKLDTISDLFRAKMTNEKVSNEFNNFDNYPNRKFKYGFISFLQVDFILNDFGDFRTLLNNYNADLMNRSSGIFSIEFAGTYKKYYAGFNLGWANDGVYNHDSLSIEFNTTQYGLHFGYNLLNTKRLLITPKIAIKWNRYGLLNYDKDKSIPIEKYMHERDLDLKFNQMIGFAGVNLSYKISNFNPLPTDYWTFGVYGGYAFKLHNETWIYSHGNRLESNGKIRVENYNFGIHFSFNFDGE
ncbi:MAG TPA: hypothetical protein DCQ31_10610 [Bacteroidales bacterium]|nr:hypothetical protein [Bacteroidales bacterium]